MITRSQQGVYKPKVMLSTCHSLPPTALLALSLPLIQKIVPQALKNLLWKQAMLSEYQALIQTKTWTLVPSPKHKPVNVIGCKWVFRVKTNLDGSLDKCNAHLVAKGFHHSKGLDYHETFSPVAKPTTIILLLSIAVHFNQPVKQLDFSNAVLHGSLHKEVYMQQPPGFVNQSNPHYLCKLHKSLYGLKQAPRAWYSKLVTCLTELNFTMFVSDHSLFIQHTSQSLTYILVYVNDILITSPSTIHCNDIIHTLSTFFPIKYLGEIHYFIGLEIQRSANSMFHSQQKYALNLLRKASMEGCKPSSTPMSSNTKLTAHQG